ncbi:RHS domain-containing protein [Xanthomonas sp. CFBP 8703]|uniref:RHS domain-containing protein n=1 Tax=Xanthomonas bonasiae TaxID=2810351 RepID=A0ABS3AWT0_9XANT|nr:RHS repeat-associated core domain-containing protein [Xanthomonas bonasiae]MBN6100820.1 RHS domain-containing protein [Xanthomonas bonasiae]
MKIGPTMKGIAKPLTKLLWLLAVALPLHAAAETVEYVHTDALGTPIAVTDASGNLIETSEYEPYGKLLNRPLTDGPGFTGHVQDAATGLTYMQQRYYDPLIGRFLSVDPVAANSISGANFNRYWYGNNNPYKFFDLDGRCTGSHISNEDGTCVSTGEYTTVAENVKSVDARNVDRVFSHASIATMGGEGIPSEIPKETRAALKKFLGSAVGGAVGREAIRQGKKIDLEQILPSSGYPPAFAGGYAGGNLITYSLEWKQYIEASKFKKEFGVGGLDVLLAHEIGHTAIGGNARGYTPITDDPNQDEFNAVRFYENPYRSYLGIPLRTTYSGIPVPAPLNMGDK